MGATHDVVRSSERVYLRLVRVGRAQDVGHVMAEPKPMQLLEPFFRYEEGLKLIRLKRTRVERGSTPDLIEATEMASHRRHLDCKSYDRCLSHAARMNWRGFSCQGCAAYEADPNWLGDTPYLCALSGETNHGC